MSKIVVLFEFAGMTHKEYDAICDELRKNNKLYNYNRPSHVAFERDGKWCVVDVEFRRSDERVCRNGPYTGFSKNGNQSATTGNIAGIQLQRSC